ncbi:acyltransferase family protein [Hydrogenophaga sp. T2]|uniref:acyltransferase family protein n=1 Tax=Hydrogenophaga sp. T2 TaxID=3132823 RepID=UPI003CF37BE4
MHAGLAVGERSRSIDPELSVWLDLSRVVAAFFVYLGHAVILEVAPAALSLTWWRSADDAVIAFFVLSGFVIASTTRERPGDAAGYALARLSRVYSVAVPALLLVLLLDLAGRSLSPETYAGYAWQYEAIWRRLLMHWLFLGEGWLGVAQPFTAEPYWSLAYEVWYYLLFGVWAFVRGPARWAAAALVLLLMGPWVLMLLPMWWLGVALSRWLAATRLSPRAALALALACAGAYAAFVLSGARDALDAASRALYAAIGGALGRPFSGGSTVHVLPDAVVALLFAALVVAFAHLRWRWPARAARAVRWLAERSFSFYLIHFSLLVLARALGVHQAGWWGNAGVLAAVLLVTGLLAAVGENRRHLYRRAFAGLLAPWLARRPPRPAA